MGAAYRKLKQADQALSFYQQSLTVAQDIPEKAFWEARVLNAMGNVYTDQKQYAQALELYQKALAIAKTLPEPEIEAQILNNIGKLQKKKLNTPKR